MVLRDEEYEDFYVKIDGKWLLIDKKILSAHPGGCAILAYKSKDASTVFHSFHVGSKPAYKMLQDVREMQKDSNPAPPQEKEDPPGFDDLNMGAYNLSEDDAKRITKEFDQLRFEVRRKGLLDGETPFFAQKILECLMIIGLAVILQIKGYYIPSALCMGLAWQQLGWMIHEYCHHQHFKRHHAATNVVGRDGDLDLLPFWATVASDLKLLEGNWMVFQMIPYQHIYWSFALPFLRISWLIQSILFVSKMDSHFFEIHRKRARIEQVTLSIHWALVLLQLYFLPTFQVRVTYFLVSQLFGGFLLAHVVTYNHYSTDKFANKSPILENYPALQLYTTRNMRPGTFIDWLWGGLNYQIEHHLFPTMPRNKLKTVMPMVKDFCAKNKLPYMVDDYFTGWGYAIEQFRNVANIAAKIVNKASA